MPQDFIKLGVTLPLNVVNLENMNIIKGIEPQLFIKLGVTLPLNVVNLENMNII